MLVMLTSRGICEQFCFYSQSSGSCMGYCGVAPRPVLVPCAHPNDTSDKFSFSVKGGLVIEFFFWAFLNDGLRSFVVWLIFIFSPSPLDST